MAKKLREKVATGLQGWSGFAAIIERGTKGRRKFAFEKKSVVFVVR
jgi:hypothetical protein